MEPQFILRQVFIVIYENITLKDYKNKIIVDFLSYGWPINDASRQIPRSMLHCHPSTGYPQNPTVLCR